MGRNTWRDEVEQTQLIIQQQPDHCFICGETVPADSPDALVQAFLDEAHGQRLAVVCSRETCRVALEASSQQTWQRLFDALTHWPDRAIYPHGPYWVIRRPHHLTFRTDQRRTALLDALSPQDRATEPSVSREAPRRDSSPFAGVVRRSRQGRPEPPRKRR